MKIFCPDCRNEIEISSLAAGGFITCPHRGCGKRVNLLNSDSNDGWVPIAPKGSVDGWSPLTASSQKVPLPERPTRQNTLVKKKEPWWIAWVFAGFFVVGMAAFVLLGNQDRKPSQPPLEATLPSDLPSDHGEPGNDISIPSSSANAPVRKNGDPYLVVKTYGRYQPSPLAGTLDLNTTSGGVAFLSNGAGPLIEETDTIPCRLGEKWGFQFQLRNVPTDRAVAYRSEMHHPPIPQPDGKILDKSVVNLTIKPGGALPDEETWSFAEGYEYELVPGTWTRKIFVDDIEVFAKSFTIVRTDSSPTAGTTAPASVPKDREKVASNAITGSRLIIVTEEGAVVAGDIPSPGSATKVSWEPFKSQIDPILWISAFDYGGEFMVGSWETEVPNTNCLESQLFEVSMTP